MMITFLLSLVSCYWAWLPASLNENTTELVSLPFHQDSLPPYVPYPTSYYTQFTFENAQLIVEAKKNYKRALSLFEKGKIEHFDSYTFSLKIQDDYPPRRRQLTLPKILVYTVREGKLIERKQIQIAFIGEEDNVEWVETGTALGTHGGVNVFESIVTLDDIYHAAWEFLKNCAAQKVWKNDANQQWINFDERGLLTAFGEHVSRSSYDLVTGYDICYFEWLE